MYAKSSRKPDFSEIKITKKEAKPPLQLCLASLKHGRKTILDRGENAFRGLTFRQSVIQYRIERTRRNPPFQRDKRGRLY
jgi:hypothetical protein